MRKYGLLVVLFFSVLVLANKKPNNELDSILEEWATEMVALKSEYSQTKSELYKSIYSLEQNLGQNLSSEQKIEVLWQLQQKRIELNKIEYNEQSEISKLRYLKGLSVVKILYEKVLSLDHHFTSVRTLSEINKLSNPNQYPEYDQVKDLVKRNKGKKVGFDLPSLLNGNGLASVISLFTNLFGVGEDKAKKEAELAKVECIIDFTLSMHNDLNTIYFETEFLRSQNEKIKTEIENLFKDYTKPIRYAASLADCRNNDDWDEVRYKLEDYLVKMQEENQTRQYRMQVELEFPIDRLMQYLTVYNDFIDEGAQYYEKFRVILDSYENQTQCESKLPIEYKKLKEDMNSSIEKFNIAYKPVEVNGSKLKEILYGINEFE